MQYKLTFVLLIVQLSSWQTDGGLSLGTEALVCDALSARKALKRKQKCSDEAHLSGCSRHVNVAMHHVRDFVKVPGLATGLPPAKQKHLAAFEALGSGTE